MAVIILRVAKEEKLIDFLNQSRESKKHFVHPNANWLKIINEGRFKVNGNFIGKNYLLKKNSQLHYYSQDLAPEPKVNKHFTTLYEDECLLVINKPAPLPVHPCGSYFHNTLTRMLKEKKLNLFTLNRLDSETSGIIFLAKKKAMMNDLTQVFLRSSKYYLTLVHGIFPSFLKVDLPLAKLNARLSHSLVHKKRGFDPNGKKSLTIFKKITTRCDKSLLIAHPLTGRTHQIRAHLLAKKFSIVGDKIYGKDEKYFLDFLQEGMTEKLLQNLEMERHFLHSYKNVFYHPILKKKITIIAKLPQDLKKAMEKNSFPLIKKLLPD